MPRAKRKAEKATPANRKTSSKEAREPTPEASTGSRAALNNAGSMPGIPGSGAAAMTWKELDKRTDVKRGRFSEREKETVLQAVKVASASV